MVEKDNIIIDWTEEKGDSGMWMPSQKGEELQGTVVETKQGLYGIQLVIENEQGTKVTTPSHKALQCRLINFKPGDNIKIQYTGTELPKVKGQQPTRLYTVLRKTHQPIEEEFV